MPQFQEFIYWCFQGLITLAALWIAKSVSELNVKIAVVIEKLDAHEKRIEKLEERE